MVAEVQNLTGLSITRYIGIDFTGFQALVTSLGEISNDAGRPVVDRHIGTLPRSTSTGRPRPGC